MASPLSARSAPRAAEELAGADELAVEGEEPDLGLTLEEGRDGDLAAAVLSHGEDERLARQHWRRPTPFGQGGRLHRAGRDVGHAGGIVGDDRQMRSLAEDVLQLLDPRVERVTDLDAFTIEVRHFAGLPVDGGDRVP